MCSLRAVTSLDGMTADVYPFDGGFLPAVATRIVNEVRGINRVVTIIRRSRPARSSGSELDPASSLRYVRKMATATMTSKGQITIPAEIRAKHRLTAGTRVDFVENVAGELVLKTRSGDIRDLYGAVTYDGPPVSIEDMNRAVGEAVAESFRRSVS